MPEKASRRRFTAEYKARFVREADACTESGQIGALLRREGLYSSHLREWRWLRDEGGLAGLSQKRGRKAKHDPKEVENAKLQRAVERLSERLRKAEHGGRCGPRRPSRGGGKRFWHVHGEKMKGGDRGKGDGDEGVSREGRRWRRAKVAKGGGREGRR